MKKLALFLLVIAGISQHRIISSDRHSEPTGWIKEIMDKNSLDDNEKFLLMQLIETPPTEISEIKEIITTIEIKSQKLYKIIQTHPSLMNIVAQFINVESSSVIEPKVEVEDEKIENVSRKRRLTINENKDVVVFGNLVAIPNEQRPDDEEIDISNKQVHDKIIGDEINLFRRPGHQISVTAHMQDIPPSIRGRIKSTIPITYKDKVHTEKLFAAIENGTCADILKTLHDGAHIGFRSNAGYTVLEMALMRKNPDMKIIRMLYRLGVNFNETIFAGRSPLVAAIRNFNMPISLIKELLEENKYNFDLNIRDTNGHTLLYLVASPDTTGNELAQERFTQIFRLLLEFGAKMDKATLEVIESKKHLREIYDEFYAKRLYERDERYQKKIEAEAKKRKAKAEEEERKFLDDRMTELALKEQAEIQLYNKNKRPRPEDEDNEDQDNSEKEGKIEKSRFDKNRAQKRKIAPPLRKSMTIDHMLKFDRVSEDEMAAHISNNLKHYKEEIDLDASVLASLIARGFKKVLSLLLDEQNVHYVSNVFYPGHGEPSHFESSLIYATRTCDDLEMFKLLLKKGARLNAYDNLDKRTAIVALVEREINLRNRSKSNKHIKKELTDISEIANLFFLNQADITAVEIDIRPGMLENFEQTGFVSLIELMHCPECESVMDAYRSRILNEMNKVPQINSMPKGVWGPIGNNLIAKFL